VPALARKPAKIQENRYNVGVDEKGMAPLNLTVKIDAIPPQNRADT